MALRLLNKFKNPIQLVRRYSKDVNYISVSVNDKNGVATVNLQRSPVNSLNLELLSQLSSTLTDLEKNKSRGMILKSSKDGIFSAGLDILEMYKPNPDRMKLFWTTLQDTWIKLYGSKYPTVALINGHSPAGGCLLAMSCEYRIMFKNYTIGLNETQLGIVAPTWFIDSMKNIIGQREAEKALTVGYRFTTDEALKVGLVDETVENGEEGMERANAFFKKFEKIPALARGLTKKYIRQETIDKLIKNREEDLNNFVLFGTQPAVQEHLGKYMEMLKKKG